MTGTAGSVRRVVAFVAAGVLGFFLLPAALAAGPKAEWLNARVNVFGLALRSTKVPGVINGVEPLTEPCPMGMEYIYDPLDLTVNYDRRGYVRRISTRNRKTSILRIRPGDPFLAGVETVRREKFSQGRTPFVFVKDDCSVTFLVGEDDVIFGLVIETLD